MKKKKNLLDYESPTTNVFELRFEGIICQSGKFGIDPWNDSDSDPIAF